MKTRHTIGWKYLVYASAISVPAFFFCPQYSHASPADESDNNKNFFVIVEPQNNTIQAVQSAHKQEEPPIPALVEPVKATAEIALPAEKILPSKPPSVQIKATQQLPSADNTPLAPVLPQDARIVLSADKILPAKIQNDSHKQLKEEAKPLPPVQETGTKEILLGDSSKLNNNISNTVEPGNQVGADIKPEERADLKPIKRDYSAFKQFLSQTNGVVALNLSEYAQKANVVEPIRLDEAVAFAIKNNLEIKASNSRNKSAALEKMAAYSRLLPSLDAKLSRGNEESMPASYNDLFGNRVLDDKHIRKDRTFAVRQPLIDLEVVADILTSTDKENLVKIQSQDDRDTVAYDTVNVYLKLVQARIAVQLADQYHAHLEELLNRMKNRVEGGGATVGDLERIKGHANLAEVARAEALGEYETNLAEFRRLTQITPAQLQVSEVLVPDIPKSLPDAIAKALKTNPAYKATEIQRDIAASTRNSAFSKITPKVSLEYSDTYSYNAGGAAKGNPVDGAYPTQQDKRLLLVAHWTLNGGLEVAEGMTALEKERETNFRSLDARSRIEEGVRASYNAINAANQRVSILQKGIESNEKVVREFEDQYKNGSRSIFELLDAHAQLYGSRVNLMRIEIARALAAYQVRRQMGDLLVALIEQEHSAKKVD